MAAAVNSAARAFSMLAIASIHTAVLSPYLVRTDQVGAILSLREDRQALWTVDSCRQCCLAAIINVHGMRDERIYERGGVARGRRCPGRFWWCGRRGKRRRNWRDVRLAHGARGAFLVGLVTARARGLAIPLLAPTGAHPVHHGGQAERGEHRLLERGEHRLRCLCPHTLAQRCPSRTAGKTCESCPKWWGGVGGGWQLCRACLRQLRRSLRLLVLPLPSWSASRAPPAAWTRRRVRLWFE